MPWRSPCTFWVGLFSNFPCTARSMLCPVGSLTSSDLLWGRKVTSSASLTVHGTWDEWSPWSLCSSTCGRGYRDRTRTCKPPQFGGNPCEGPEKQTKFCNIALCPGRDSDRSETSPPAGPPSSVCSSVKFWTTPRRILRKGFIEEAAQGCFLGLFSLRFALCELLQRIWVVLTTLHGLHQAVIAISKTILSFSPALPTGLKLFCLTGFVVLELTNSFTCLCISSI